MTPKPTTVAAFTQSIIGSVNQCVTGDTHETRRVANEMVERCVREIHKWFDVGYLAYRNTPLIQRGASARALQFFLANNIDTPAAYDHANV